MCEVICVTASKLADDFISQIELIARSEVKMIILREKQLSEEEYFSLAQEVNKICLKYGKNLVIHNFIDVAKRLGIRQIHLPFSVFTSAENLHKDFELVGTSVHSVADAVLAQKLGADYITAGHIFATDCKRGLEPRGTRFLEEVCKSVKIPVYAIGGINENTAEKLKEVKSSSFSGACVMSSFMRTDNPEKLVCEIRGKMTEKKVFDKKQLALYAVTDRHWLNGRTLSEAVEEAVSGGVTMIQLREKGKSFEEFCEEAQKILAVCRKYCVPLIINDSTEVALKVGADGVHLGQGDMSPVQARKILGCNRIIGVTARSVEQAVQAEKDGADYIGSGAVFGTTTKGDAVKMSLETLDSICSAVKIPVCAIGGINNDNIMQLQGCKISGAAVVSGIFAAENIKENAREMREKICRIISE